MITERAYRSPAKPAWAKPVTLPLAMLCFFGAFASPIKAAVWASNGALPSAAPGATDTGGVAGARVGGDQNEPPAYPAPSPVVRPLPAPPVVQRQDADPQAATAGTRTRTKWYGWQIIVANGVGLLGGGLVSLASDQSLPVLLGWTLAGSVVHAAHGRPASAVGSVLLRVALPVAGAYVGYAIDHSDPSDYLDGLGGIVMGGILGMASATVIDAVVLARSTDVVPAYNEPGPRTRAMSVPVVGVGRNGDVSVGWRGTF